MTNTHINVGGHKITTNKVGSVHTITSGFLNGHSGKITWCVTNGICVVNIEAFTRSSTAGWADAYSSLPKTKIIVFSEITETMFIRITSTTLEVALGGSDLGKQLFTSLVYPVADDWVES